MKLEEVEDYYCFYVQIMKLPEDLFWTADIAMLDRIIENKQAYDSWEAYAMEKERERMRYRHGR